MIKVAIRDIVDGLGVIKDLSTKTMPAVTAYKVARLLKNILEEYNLYNKTRLNLINKYAELNDDGSVRTNGQNIVIQNDKIQVCNEEIQQLLDSEVELNASALTLDELDALSFTPAQMYLLQPFINENE